jgi:hypothetical protein
MYLRALLLRQPREEAGLALLGGGGPAAVVVEEVLQVDAHGAAV